MIDKLARIFGSKTKALEIVFLIQDLKPVVRQGFYDEELPKIIEFCKKNKLEIETSNYKVLLADNSHYSNKGIKIPEDDPRKGMHFVYISKDKGKAIMANVLEMKNDHRSFGMLLGYPKCCVDFYVKNASEMAKTDNDFLRQTVKSSKGYNYPFFSNIGKRSMDITLLSHFPCRFDCEESIKLAKKNLDLMKQHFPRLAERYQEELKGRVLMFDRFFEFE